MPTDNSKALEIKRLTTPLTFDKLNAYDSEGNIITCIETINEVGYVIEPKEGILSDDEILKYAPKSKAASRVRLWTPPVQVTPSGAASYMVCLRAAKSLQM